MENGNLGSPSGTNINGYEFSASASNQPYALLLAASRSNVQRSKELLKAKPGNLRIDITFCSSVAGKQLRLQEPWSSTSLPQIFNYKVVGNLAVNGGDDDGKSEDRKSR